jgi:hypothetical protein
MLSQEWTGLLPPLVNLDFLRYLVDWLRHLHGLLLLLLLLLVKDGIRILAGAHLENFLLNEFETAALASEERLPGGIKRLKYGHKSSPGYTGLHLSQLVVILVVYGLLLLLVALE